MLIFGRIAKITVLFKDFLPFFGGELFFRHLLKGSKRLQEVPDVYLFLKLSVFIDLDPLLLVYIQALTLALFRASHL